MLDRSLLLASARGEIALARVLGIPAEALQAARALAGALAAHGETDRARTILEGCLALDGGDFEAAVALAEMALERGDAAAAIDAAGQALAAGGGEARAPRAALLFARALLLAGERAHARAWLTRLSARNDEHGASAARLLGRLPPAASGSRPPR